MMKKRVIVIGAGDRGNVYAGFALRNPDLLEIAGVAEPNDARRNLFAKRFAIPESCCFRSWEDILSVPAFADGAVIATQDHMHIQPALTALDRGYSLLLEKPMALTEAHCRAIADASERTALPVSVCHVLRYTNFFSTVKRVLDEGTIGTPLSIYHAENVSYYHMAHSYVRGNWGNSERSSPMILAKCCHDLDLLCWFASSRIEQIASIGTLSLFRKENAPEGAPARCTDGCPAEESCLYNAQRTYLRGTPLFLDITKGDNAVLSSAARFVIRHPMLSHHIPVLKQFSPYRGWPVSTITEDLSDEGILAALKSGPYGRCVFRTDNDQVDHQHTQILFRNGITATLNMHGHSDKEGRTLRIDGTGGTLKGVFGGGGRLDLHIHRTGRKITLPVKTDITGHSEGDDALVRNFVSVLNGEKPLTTAEESLQSHLAAFAAHTARVERRVVKMG